MAHLITLSCLNPLGVVVFLGVKYDKAKAERIFNDLKKDAKTFNEFVGTLAETVRGAIIIRVQNTGKAVSGSVMKYKKTSYLTKRQNEGRVTAYKDLTYTGKMMESMTTSKVSDGTYKIHFGSKDEQAKAQANQDRQEWFGISKNENKIIDAEINKLLGKVFK